MELLVDEHSALSKTNLRSLILDPEVWKLITPEQVARVQKYWPGDSYNGNLSALASNDHLRHDIAEYQKALADGQHDPEWIRQAKAANKLRNERFAAEVEKTKAVEKGEDKSDGNECGQTNGKTSSDESEEPSVAVTKTQVNVGGGGGDKETDQESDRAEATTQEMNQDNVNHEAGQSETGL